MSMSSLIIGNPPEASYGVAFRIWGLVSIVMVSDGTQRMLNSRPGPLE